jgi:hypothetical protein
MDAVSKELEYSLYFLLATLGVTIGVPIFMLITGQADMPSTIISLVSGLGAFGRLICSQTGKTHLSL